MLLFAEEAHQAPLIVQFINHYFGEPFYNFEVNVTKRLWDQFLGIFGSSAEGQFGPYTPENAIPWYTIMFVIACILTIILVTIFKGKISPDDPKSGQLTLEAGYI